MKRLHSHTRLLSLLIAAAALLATSCQHSAPSAQGAADATDTLAEKTERTDSDHPGGSAALRVSRPVAAPFDVITNLGSVDIVYTQGDYSLEAEGDSAAISWLVTDYDSQVLTVSQRFDTHTDPGRFAPRAALRLYVSCPSLRCVSVCGSGSFTARGAWRESKLEVGVIGSGAMLIDSVQCAQFHGQMDGSGHASIGHLKADDALVIVRGSAPVDLSVDAGLLSLYNNGSGAISIAGRAGHVNVRNSKDPNLKLQIEPTAH